MTRKKTQPRHATPLSSSAFEQAWSSMRAPQAPPPTVSARWLVTAASLAIVAAAICAWLTLCLLFWQGSWQLLYHPASAVTRTPAFRSSRIRHDRGRRTAFEGLVDSSRPRRPSQPLHRPLSARPGRQPERRSRRPNGFARCRGQRAGLRLSRLRAEPVCTPQRSPLARRCGVGAPVPDRNPKHSGWHDPP